MGVAERIAEQLKGVKLMRRKFTGTLYVEFKEGHIIDWHIVTLGEGDGKANDESKTR